MHKLENQRHKQYEISQINFTDCCSNLVKTYGSSHSIEFMKNDISFKKPSKEKGINITSKAKSFSNLPSQSKLILKKTEPEQLKKPTCKRQENLKQMVVRSSFDDSAKKALLVQRCLKYKNKQVLEHRLEGIQPSYCLQKINKQDELYSTSKNTARTLRNSQFTQGIDKTTYLFFNNLSVENSILKSSNYQSTQKELTPRKTLQQVFEERTGKKIMTFQSIISVDQQPYSIVESYILSKNEF